MYISDMAERLNSLAYAQHQHNFNPRSVSFDIRSPEELAAVNEFLVTLGRDVAVGPARHAQAQAHAASMVPPPDFFDPVSLGIAGMPGIPNAFATDAGYPSQYNQYSGHSHSRNYSTGPGMYDGQGLGAYPSPVDYAEPPSSRRHSAAAGKYASPYHHSTPPLDISSPHSSVSSGTSPSHDFDFPRSRDVPPVATLAPVDFLNTGNMKMRPMVSLKSSPLASSSSTTTLEPRLTPKLHRGPPAKLTPVAAAESSSSSGQRLYPMLTEGDAEYKLPPLQAMYPRASSSSPSPPSSRESSVSPTPTAKLPGVNSLTRRSSDSDELTNDVKRIELSTPEIAPEDRQKHAEFIRSLLVNINQGYKEKFGSPKMVHEDVAMANP